MIRQTEWIVGVVVAAVLAAVMFVSIAFVEGAALRVVLLVLGGFLAAAAASVATLRGYVATRAGRTESPNRRARARQTAGRLKTWHALGGVVTLWAVAAIAVALITIAPAFTPYAAILAAVAVILAAVATVWGDVVQHEAPYHGH